MAGSPSWVHLLALMVAGPSPEPTVRGTIRSRVAEGDAAGPTGWFAYTPIVRVFPADGTAARIIQVWRDGARVRIADAEGLPGLIIGEEASWRFESEHSTPVEADPGSAVYVIPGAHLLTRRSLNEFAVNTSNRYRDYLGVRNADVLELAVPIVATTFLDRPAWTVQLDSQCRPHPLQLVVDAETGLVLQERSDAVGTVVEWVEFIVGETLDASLFRWDGPIRSSQDAHRDALAEHEAEMTRRLEWFRANVTTAALEAEVTYPLPVEAVHEHNEATGAFLASLGDVHHHGMLARRPRSTQPWNLGWSRVQHQWSTPSWDWAVNLDHAALTPAALQALKRQLATT